MRSCLAALLICVLALGCASRGVPFDREQVSHIEVGRTDESQLLEWFGEPQTMRSRPSGFSSWRYMHEAQEIRSTRSVMRVLRSIGQFFRLGWLFAPVHVEYRNTVRHELVVALDPAGVVIDYAYERTEIPSKQVF